MSFLDHYLGKVAIVNAKVLSVKTNEYGGRSGGNRYRFPPAGFGAEPQEDQDRHALNLTNVLRESNDGCACRS